MTAAVQAKHIANLTGLKDYEIRTATRNREGIRFLVPFKDRAKRLEILKSIQKLFPNSRLKVTTSQSAELELSPSVLVVVKPSKEAGGSTELLGIQTSKLLAGAPKERIEWNGLTFDAFAFRNHRTLEQVIVNGLRRNSKVPPFLANFFDELFRKGNYSKFVWPAQIEQYQKNEAAKYIGELLLGVTCMSSHAGIIHPTLAREGAIEAFFLPTASQFAAIDSLILLKSGKWVPISNKAGLGAAASIFANILPKGLEYYSSLRDSKFRRLVELAKKANITKPERAGTELVYLYGCREILGISEKLIQNPLHVQKQILEGKFLSPEVVEVTARVQERTNNPFVIQNLPHSITGYFTREIADQLNKDAESTSQMVNILSGKEYYQVNLNVQRWNAGSVDFKSKRTDSVSIKFTGNKAAYTNAYAKQGLVNFVLT